MFVLKNAEELNKLFMRNKDMSILMDENDRNTFHELINELPTDSCSNPLHTFLALQVIYYRFTNYYKIFNINYFRNITILLK